MLSSIKITYADLGDGKGIRPMINVQIINSDDPRDILLKNLFETAGNHLRIKYQPSPYMGEVDRVPQKQTIMLVPEERDYDLEDANRKPVYETQAEEFYAKKEGDKPDDV